VKYLSGKTFKFRHWDGAIEIVVVKAELNEVLERSGVEDVERAFETGVGEAELGDMASAIAGDTIPRPSGGSENDHEARDELQLSSVVPSG
jgi:hypothetical protein